MTAKLLTLPPRATPKRSDRAARREVARLFVAGRRALGHTQESLALELGRSPRTIVRWEAAERSIPGEDLWAVLRKCRAAGVPCPLCESEERRAA
jgi:DNA-binding XRE family transcriptional regulator